jgi:O-antigen/teichoic acid export membrane protein
MNKIALGKGLRQLLTTRLYGNALYLMFNAGVTSILGFFFWVVVARFYTEAEVGFSSAIISAIGLLVSFSLLGLDFSLIRFLPQVKKPEQLINTCLTLSGLAGLAALAIFLAGLGLWAVRLRFITQNAIFASAFIAFTLAWILSRLIESAFLAKRRAEFTLYKNTIFSLLKIPLPIFFVLYFHTFGIVASWGIASSIALVLSLFLFLPKIHSPYKPVPNLNLPLLKHIWRYSGGSYLANLFSEANLYLLPVMVVSLLGAESNAYYYLARMMASFLFTIPMAVSSSLFAESSHFEGKLREDTVRSLKFTFLLLIPPMLLFIFAGKWLLLLFGESYSINALYLLQILAISSLPMVIGRIYCTILRVTNRIRELTIISGLVTIAVLLISYLVMPLTGIIGLGYVWLGVQSLFAVYVFARKASLW